LITQVDCIAHSIIYVTTTEDGYELNYLPTDLDEIQTGCCTISFIGDTNTGVTVLVAGEHQVVDVHGHADSVILPPFSLVTCPLRTYVMELIAKS
jgi:hypothetical protein